LQLNSKTEEHQPDDGSLLVIMLSARQLSNCCFNLLNEKEMIAPVAFINERGKASAVIFFKLPNTGELIFIIV
jgi:hypothetical protein